jgi:hypothetical protein
VLRYFASFRQAWAAAGIDAGRSAEPWSAIEDWYLREAAGLLPRTELAADLRRSAQAVHRRLYDLGIDSYQRWGWTLHRVERAAQVPRHILQTYLDRGDIPYLRGSKVVYVDPGDLVDVLEIDWDLVAEELAQAALHSWRQRLVTSLTGKDWRVGRVYRAQPINRTDRRWRPRLLCPRARPTAPVAGQWARVTDGIPGREQCAGRVGLVRLVYWSHNTASHNPARINSEPQWMARIEFNKQRMRGSEPCVTYTVPVALLEPAQQPGGSDQAAF